MLSESAGGNRLKCFCERELRKGCEGAFGHPTLHILHEIRWCTTSSRTLLGRDYSRICPWIISLRGWASGRLRNTSAEWEGFGTDLVRRRVLWGVVLPQPFLPLFRQSITLLAALRPLRNGPLQQPRLQGRYQVRLTEVLPMAKPKLPHQVVA